MRLKREGGACHSLCAVAGGRHRRGGARRLAMAGHTDDRNHLFRTIATSSAALVLTAPLDGSVLAAGGGRALAGHGDAGDSCLDDGPHIKDA
jgi:hypothetical protein